VRAQEREAVLVLLDLLQINVPALHRMTLFTVSAKLTTMNIRMAVSTAAANIAEHHLGVALRARHFLVHATKRKLRLVVVKFRKWANGLPSGSRVTILTRNVQIPVRAARDGLLRRSRLR
jgi:hypothetical protein